MAEIIAGVALSHSPFIMTNEAAGGDKGQNFIRSANEMNKWLKEIGADVMVLISDDHFHSYFYNQMPSFTIGIEECEGWGDWEIPPYKIPVQQELARHILNTGLEQNVDFAFTMSMKVDHGHTQAIYFLNSELEVPVVPIAVNSVAPPLPTMDRCFQVGEVLKKAIESWDPNKKVAVVASGGLSHWVPVPKINSTKPEEQEMVHFIKHGPQVIKESDEEFNKKRQKRTTDMVSGPVNDEMDEFFLKCITDRDYDTLRNWSYEYIEEHLGNGGQEIRNWMVLLGCLQDLEAEVSCYEAIPEWVTGMAIVQFAKQVNNKNQNQSLDSKVTL